MDCDNCFFKGATAETVCLPVLLKIMQNEVVEGDWKKVCDHMHKIGGLYGFCRITGKKVKCCKSCPSFV